MTHLEEMLQHGRAASLKRGELVRSRLIIDGTGLGLGTLLVDEMERRLAGQARLVVVETAGRADYAPTRAFYEARGYRAVGLIPDFYAELLDRDPGFWDGSFNILKKDLNLSKILNFKFVIWQE